MNRSIRMALCLVLSSALSLAGPLAAGGLTTSPVTKLASNEDYKEAFASDGTTVVYTDLPSQDGSPFGRIGVHNLGSGVETVVAGDARNPAVSGDTLVFEHQIFTGNWAGPGSIRALDLRTMEEREVATAARDGAQLQQPRIDGDTVVYTGNGGIHGVDLSTGATFTVTTSSRAYAADISHGWIVYCTLKTSSTPPSGTHALQGDIMAYNISTKQTYTLCGEKHDQRNPRIGSTGVVVWDDERNAPDWKAEFAHDGTDVYGCSVYNRTNFAVAKGAGHQSGGSIHGNLIMYYDSKAPDGYGALGWDLLSGTRFGLAPKSSLSGAAMSGGMILYGRNRLRSDGSGELATDLYVVQPAQLEVTEASDAYRDAVAASQDAFPAGADMVTIAGASSWTADLAAASFVETDQPLLLTRIDSLPDVTAAELRRLGARSATIIGGSSVSAAVQAEIQAIIDENIAAASSEMSIAARRLTGVERIGGDRYAISNTVAARVAARPGWDGTVLVVSGSRASDAMSVIPLVSARSMPVLLSPTGGLSADQVALLTVIGAERAVIVGNTGSVPSRTASRLVSLLGSANVTRLSGADVYATSALVAGYGVSHLGLSWNGVGLATTESFANAVTGGLRKGAAGSVVVLTRGTTLSASASSVIKTHRTAIRRASYLGSRHVLTKTVRGQVRAILH